MFEAQVADGAAVVWATWCPNSRQRHRSILAAERFALNFMQRMSGMATTTRKAMDCA